jgi:ribosomal protein S18 acetylase RimI-like enzyme
MNDDQPMKITYHPITEDDLEFLYEVYASTREAELTAVDWSHQEKENFLRMQFDLQHKQWIQFYDQAAFEIILIDGNPAGRLYVDRREKEIRIIDIALLTEFRRQGIGSRIMKALIAEADQVNLPLSLHVEMYNPAMGLYQKLGFKKIQEVGVYFLMEKHPA